MVKSWSNMLTEEDLVKPKTSNIERYTASETAFLILVEQSKYLDAVKIADNVTIEDPQILAAKSKVYVHTGNHVNAIQLLAPHREKNYFFMLRKFYAIALFFMKEFESAKREFCLCDQTRDPSISRWLQKCEIAISRGTTEEKFRIGKLIKKKEVTEEEIEID